MIIDRKTASAVGGKTARACDSCLRKRARWYCAADDAFLCQGCDASVHLANPLASRHERVRLGTASFKGFGSSPGRYSMPVWHKGFTRKARTPRQPKLALKHNIYDKGRTPSSSSLVPEMETELLFDEETEAQLLYRVPILDPFAAKLCNLSNDAENEQIHYKVEAFVRTEPNTISSKSGYNEVCDLDNLPVFLPSEMELAEFAADVETLLGTGLDDESCRIEGLGLIDCKEENHIMMDDCYEGCRVKNEDGEVVEGIIDCGFDSGFDMSKDTLDWNFDYESPVTGEEEVEEEEEKVVVAAETESMSSDKKNIRRGRFLRLNYEDVITSWDNKGCPWTSGIRPEINPDDCLTDFLVSLCFLLF